MAIDQFTCFSNVRYLLLLKGFDMNVGNRMGRDYFLKLANVDLLFSVGRKS